MASGQSGADDAKMAATMKAPSSPHYGEKVRKRKERTFKRRMASLKNGGTYR